jgi:hypothetical protein
MNCNKMLSTTVMMVTASKKENKFNYYERYNTSTHKRNAETVETMG